MSKKKKKIPCFTEMAAEEMGVSQKTVQNLIRISTAIESGIFPPNMVEDYKNDRISKSKMLEYLIQSDKGKERLIFRVKPELKEIFETFKVEGKIIEEKDSQGRPYKMPVRFNKDNIIGIVKKHGTNKIFWLELGLYNLETESGVGRQKIFGKHYENKFQKWGEDWNSPEKIADNILEILDTKEEIDSKFTIEQGHTYLYELKIKGKVRYLLIGIGTNGFINTAHPYGKNYLENNNY